MRVISAAADETRISDEIGTHGAVHVVDDLHDLGHGFRADAITGQKKKRMRHVLGYPQDDRQAS